MPTMEEIVREYCIYELTKQIYNQDLAAEEARRMNADVGWVILGSYRLGDGTYKDIFIPRYRSSKNSLEEAISRANKMKANKL
jgi:hypothetical protein